MKKPAMIIFDYGHTLVYEDRFDIQLGWTAVLQQVKKNPDNVSVQKICDVSTILFKKILEETKEIEVHNHAFQRFLYEYLQLEFDASFDELEERFWNAAAPGVAMPWINELLTFLSDEKIRTAVISNLTFSHRTLSRRIAALIPNNNFEFIIPTSEYGFKKPQHVIFELALAKAQLPAEDVWYCGDNVIADIHGANAVGIHPVWYCYEKQAAYKNYSDIVPSCPHTKIKKWNELTEIIRGCKQ